jgi:Tol biopolymer transport system component
MAETLSDEPSRTDEQAGDRLDSWKEIATYLNRDVTTVQRWEKREHMPVHRHVHEKLGTVYAFKADLDAWSRGRSPRGTNASGAEDVPNDAEVALPGGAVVNAKDAPSIAVGPDESLPNAPKLRLRKWMAPVAVAVAVSLGALFWALERSDHFWRNPLASAHFEHLVDFGGIAQAAAISSDGRLVAFLSDRDGQMDVWLTQVGTGRFYNLTKGAFLQLVNSSVRTLGFSPDGSLVTFWTRKHAGSSAEDINIWAAPILGGHPRPYLEGVAEFDWSSDGAQLVYHTPGPGDPTFVKRSDQPTPGHRIFTAPAGLHAHYPFWSNAQNFIYFVQGTVPDAMDIWRIRPNGEGAERITDHNSSVSHPVQVNERTLMYLATESNGSGPWLHVVDVELRVPHRISTGIDRYTSLAAGLDGRRVVATLANPKETLWRVHLADGRADSAGASRVPLATGPGFSPRLGPDYLLYGSRKSTGDGIWKLADGETIELWSLAGARIIGGPAIAVDGRKLAFSIERSGKSQLYVVNTDGTDARILTESLTLRGSPAWAPDGRSITSAALEGQTPHLFRIPLDGGPATRLLDEYSLDPVWEPHGNFVVYSGPDVGTTFPLRAITTHSERYTLPPLTLTRGARRICFLPGQHGLVVLRGEMHHKNLWLIDLETGAERQLTDVDPGFEVRDFDVSPDGREIVLDRVEELSDIVLIDVPSAD